jgi:hypothetical protein
LNYYLAVLYAHLEEGVTEIETQMIVGKATEKHNGRINPSKWPSGVMVATGDLKSLAQKWACEFESRLGYKMSVILDKTHQNVLNNGHFSLWPCSPIGRGISFKHCTVRVRIPMGLQPIHEGRLNDIGKDN